VRLQRFNNYFYYYYSSNGTNWTWWTSYDSSVAPEGPLPNTLVLGFALTSHDTGRTVDAVAANFTGVNDGPLRFGLQPTNTVAVEGGNATFAVTALGTSPYLYQWLTNGVNVEGATNTTLTMTRIPYSMNGSLISCRLSNPPGESVLSTNALLSIVKDTNAPTVVFWAMPKINLTETEVRLLYSEPMNRAQAETIGNYVITTDPGNTPLSISSAVLQSDERTVVLTVNPQVPGTLYKVVVNNVGDQACCPQNFIPANSTDFYYYPGTTGQFMQRADGFVFMEAENYQTNTVATTPAGASWMVQKLNANYSGSGYINVTNVRASSGTANLTTGQTGARVDYVFVTTRPATNYTLWLRGSIAPDGDPAGNNDSLYVGLNGNLVATGPATGQSVEFSQMTGWGSTAWDWRSDGANADPLVITNLGPGTHYFTIWHREDGTCVDKICLEPGVRAGVGNSAEPAQAASNGGMGDNETWDFTVAPPLPPTIAIVNPTNNQTFVANSTIQIDLNITNYVPVVLVEVFSGTNLIGSSTTATTTFTWPNVPEGIYNLTARVTDGLGNRATSAAVRVVVDSSKPIAYAVGSQKGMGIGVYFTDVSGLDPVSATNLANYVVNNGAVQVTNAVLEPDGQSVILALASPVTGTFSVKIENVADLGFGPSVMNPTTLQADVQSLLENRDIGTPSTNNPALFADPVIPGTLQAIGNNGYYVRAGGSDIWNPADGMHFAYQQMTGDFDVSVRVANVTFADVWSKAGLMIREDLTQGSRNYLLAATPTNGQNLITLQWRPAANVATVSIADASRPRPSLLPNSWLRLTRTNQTFTFLYGTNGVNWINLFSTNNATAYPSAVYVGLATTSHNNGTNWWNATSAYYYNLTGLTPPLPPATALTARVQGNNLVLSWTSPSAAFRVQRTPGFPAAWGPEPTPVVANGNNYSVTIPLGPTPYFYRLIAP
jgi:hypothetical protein